MGKSQSKFAADVVAVVALALPGIAQAALYDVGGGMIYDSVLNITWLQNANLSGTQMTWAQANTWVNGLTFDGVGGWRLPTLTPVGGGTVFNVNTPSFDGSTDYGYNISYPGPGGKSPDFTGNELAYMFFVELGNLATRTTSGGAQAGGGLTNASFIDASTGLTDSFLNLQGQVGFWTDITGTDGYAFDFKTSGFNDRDNMAVQLYAGWAVHDGDVGAPVPPSLLTIADAVLTQLYSSSTLAHSSLTAAALLDPPGNTVREPSMGLLSIVTLSGLLWVVASRRAKPKTAGVTS